MAKLSLLRRDPRIPRRRISVIRAEEFRSATRGGRRNAGLIPVPGYRERGHAGRVSREEED